MDLHPPPGTLPPEFTSFVGRRAVLKDVRAALGHAHLVTLIGPGGVGKTRVAIRAAGEMRRVFSDGVFFADLSQQSDPTMLADALVATFRLPVGRDQTTVDALCAQFAGRNALLVLDNCEHMVAAVAALAHAVLLAAPTLRILTTSRERLAVPGEHVLPVPPLGLGEIGAEASSTPAEASKLFLNRAMFAAPTSSFSDEQLHVVAEICRRLEGVPLAIELAAARLGALSVDQLLARLTNPLQILTGGARTVHNRQRALRSSVDWSFQLCTTDEQRLWSRLSIFRGWWTLDAAEAVCAGRAADGLDAALTGNGRLLDDLQSLVDKSIVRHDANGGGQYRMLEPTRQFGFERLAESGELVQLEARHRKWIARLLQTVEAEWVGPRQGYWLDRMPNEMGNIRVALESALREPGDAAEALELIVPAWRPVWFITGFREEMRAWLDRILPRVAAPSPLHAQALVARSVARAGTSYANHDQKDLADARAMAERIGDHTTLVVADILEHLALMFRERFAEARALIERTYATLQDTDPIDVRNFVVRMLAIVTYALGDPRSATFQEQLYELPSERADPYSVSDMLIYVGRLASLSGDQVSAERDLRRALLLRRDIREYVGAAMAIQLLAVVAGRTGDPDRAARLVGCGERVYSAVGPAEARFPMYRGAVAHAQEVARQALPDEVVDARIAEGRAYSVDEAIQYAATDARPAPASPNPSDAALLTRREREVVALIAQGLTNRQIASRLTVSVRTAEGHVERVLIKLGFTSRAEIVAWALTSPQGVAVG